MPAPDAVQRYEGTSTVVKILCVVFWEASPTAGWFDLLQ